MENADHIIDLSKATLVELAYDYAAAEDSRNMDRLILYDAEIRRRGADVDFDNIYQRILGSLAMGGCAMTDREMLELSAKAAGIVGEYSEEKKCFSSYMEPGWNPLADDGDALRLAVDLKIKINVAVGNGYAAAQVDGVVFVSEPTRKDPYAATRRAITRAAAEIGKAMP